jgi:hypothetical protein
VSECVKESRADSAREVAVELIVSLVLLLPVKIKPGTNFLYIITTSKWPSFHQFELCDFSSLADLAH